MAGLSDVVPVEAADPLRFPAVFLAFTERLSDFVLWLWTSPKDRGVGHRKAASVDKIVVAFGMYVQKTLLVHVTKCHTQYKRRIKGMERLEATWGITGSRKYALIGVDLWAALPMVSHPSLVVVAQLRVALLTGLVFCLRVGELVRCSSQQSHYLRRRALSVVKNREGRVTGVKLVISTSKGVWRVGMEQGRSLVLRDPSRLGRCCVCSAWFLKGPQDGRARCALHLELGAPPLVVNLDGMEPHYQMLPILLNYAEAGATCFVAEALFPALDYRKVAGALHQVADFLKVPRSRLCTHSLRRGGTCDKARAVDLEGKKLYTEDSLGVFGRWCSKIWHLVYPELAFSELVWR